MGNRIAWPIIHLVQRVSMILTLGCCIYLVLFLIFKDHDNNASLESGKADTDLVSLTPVLDLKTSDTATAAQTRDIFSLSEIGPSGVAENTPKGQLPAHLKIVAIVIADPSQIVIEDTFAKKTYFIDQGHPQDGIKIVKMDNRQITVNYQGQDIPVPITKN